MRDNIDNLGRYIIASANVPGVGLISRFRAAHSNSTRERPDPAGDREHDFGGEERAPFAGGHAVRRRTALQFVSALRQPDQPGLAKRGNQPRAKVDIEEVRI